MSGKLYLIPTTLGDSPIDLVIPNLVSAQIKAIKYFIVEDIRTTRRFLKKVDKDIDIDALTFFTLNKHTSPKDKSNFLLPAKEGHDIGIISEAGCPGIADPGADIAAEAHIKKIQVIPLVGPSSILLILMASGLNGQNFAFNGYLPIKPDEKAKRVRQLEGRSRSENQTQAFIEAPYRNNKMIQDLISLLHPNTRLCIACDITLDTEFIQTKTIAEWKKQTPDLHKRPTMFAFLA
ncbi:SAM-dependent methyltransferase [bacterium]|nr:SAM-dependent methyltransferase [bacterium]